MKLKRKNLLEIDNFCNIIENELNILEIDNLNPIRYDTDFNYILDILSVLKWVRKNIEEDNQNEIFLELKKMKKKIEAYEDGFIPEKYRIFLDEKFNRNFKYRKSESALSGLSVSDACDWLLGNYSDNEFLYEYFHFDTLKEKLKGNMPIELERGIIMGMPIKELEEREKEELFSTIDEIADIQKELIDLKQKREGIGHKKFLIRARELKNISLEKNERDKRKYPNLATIHAELVVRLSNNQNFLNLDKEYKNLINRENGLKIIHNKLIDKKSILMGILLEEEKVKVDGF